MRAVLEHQGDNRRRGAVWTQRLSHLGPSFHRRDGSQSREARSHGRSYWPHALPDEEGCSGDPILQGQREMMAIEIQVS